MSKQLAKESADGEGLRPLLHSLRELIERARQRALQAVDVVQVQTCWEIGRHILTLNRAELAVRSMANGCCQPWPIR
jgi:hypothetical protein